LVLCGALEVGLHLGGVRVEDGAEGLLDHVCLRNVSSVDKVFVLMVVFLREKGKRVLGIG
jgi:hypothetical protein